MIGPGMTFGADVRMQSCTGWNHSGMAQNCIQAAVNDALPRQRVRAPWLAPLCDVSLEFRMLRGSTCLRTSGQ